MGVVKDLFAMDDVTSFLSQRITGVIFLDASDSVVQYMIIRMYVLEFMKNILRIVNSVASAPLRGNCRGGNPDRNG